MKNKLLDDINNYIEYLSSLGLLVTVQDGRAVHIAGDPNHPFTRGTLCPKMAHYERTVHSKGRIMTPLKRIGKKGGFGGFPGFPGM